MKRAGGILLHVTSLPSRQGTGTIGRQARDFVTALAGAGQSYWQVLPVGPTGYRDSPYQSPSTFAGNPLLIDLEDLVDEDLLSPPEIAPLAQLPGNPLDFGAVIAAKLPLLHLAASRLRADASWEQFLRTPWLEDYVAFTALKEQHQMAPWTEWSPPLRERRPAELRTALASVRQRIETEVAVQYLFHRQWTRLAKHCGRLGVALIGDVPIFVAHDSADVWARPDLFDLAADGQPNHVAGVPPDYFAVTGQRWGNPLYRWSAHRADGYQWWKDRMEATWRRFDLVRVDHFRGFCAYWEIPAGEDTAVNGRWVEGPKADLFTHLAAGRQLPIIAEDLGIITEDVTALRTRFGFPGMRVAQFGFDDEPDTALHHPDNYPADVVAFTGTHDNDTTVGWFWGENRRHDRRRLRKDRRQLLARTGTKGQEVNWDLIELVLESKADTAIIPAQDVLGLGAEARMNTPGQEEGNWVWRLTAPIPDDSWVRLGEITKAARR